MHFLFTDGKTDRKRWGSLPSIKSLISCLSKALGTAFSTCPGEVSSSWTGGGSLAPSAAYSNWAGWRVQLTAATFTASSDGLGNNLTGTDFQFCILISDPNWLWDDQSYVQRWITWHCQTCSTPPWGSVSSLTPHWVTLNVTFVCVCRGRAPVLFLCTSMWQEGWIFMLMDGMQFDFC